ncbi:MAG: TrkA C-terminal domain-containing protein, partial [Melioribacteraceae bacterium]|nr:TrkA C-terminal domain-containing protein [Melioribacteraceae bacterium]
ISKVTEGYSIIEKRAIPKFFGKTLVQLRLRNTYGLEVLMIKQSQDIYADNANEFNIIMPDPDYIIKETDILVLFGPDEKIAESNHW